VTKPNDPLIQDILRRRAIATLATDNDDGSIHLTAVWFFYENGRIYIGTQSQTRKARNLRAQAQR
jgi:general stress protein 26